MTNANRWLPKMLIMLPLVAGLSACNLTDNGGNDTGADDDTSDGSGTGETEGPGDTGEAATVTIFDIQQGMVAENTTVNVKDVVVTSPVNFESGGVFVQEQQGGEFSGIYLYMWNEVVDGVQLTPGDVVTVTGEYVVFYGMSQITVRKAADLEVVGDAEPPAPAVVPAADIATGGDRARNFQGVLVQIENATVTQPANQHGEFVVEGGLLVDDFFLAPGDAPDPDVGAVYDSIVGPLYFAFDKYRILPRNPGDLVGGDGGVTGDTYTIYDIQQGRVREGTRVLVEDVIVSTPITYKGDMFFVQEAEGGEHGGIAVFVHDETGLDVRVGDVIRLDGRYQEFHGQSQIVLDSPADFETTGRAEPTATLVSSSDVATGGSLQASYEGVLVVVENAEVTTDVDQYGEFVVDDVLIVDDLFFTGGGPDPQSGTVYSSITGVMAYDYEEAKLSPRDLDDLVTR